MSEEQIIGSPRAAEQSRADAGSHPALAPANWLEVAEDVAAAVEASVLKRAPRIIRKASEDLYIEVMEAAQDYLSENLTFNIASQLASAERARSEAYHLRRLNADLLEALTDLLTSIDQMDPDQYHCSTRAYMAGREAISKALATPSDTHEVG